MAMHLPTPAAPDLRRAGRVATHGADASLPRGGRWGRLRPCAAPRCFRGRGGGAERPSPFCHGWARWLSRGHQGPLLPAVATGDTKALSLLRGTKPPPPAIATGGEKALSLLVGTKAPAPVVATEGRQRPFRLSLLRLVCPCATAPNLPSLPAATRGCTTDWSAPAPRRADAATPGPSPSTPGRMLEHRSETPPAVGAALRGLGGLVGGNGVFALDRGANPQRLEGGGGQWGGGNGAVAVCTGGTELVAGRSMKHDQAREAWPGSRVEHWAEGRSTGTASATLCRCTEREGMPLPCHQSKSGPGDAVGVGTRKRGAARGRTGISPVRARLGKSPPPLAGAGPT